MKIVPSLETRMRVDEWNRAYGFWRGKFMSWFRKGSAEEDRVVAEANAVILDNLSNADSVNKIQDATERNLRDQVSIEEAIGLYEEQRLRRWGFVRN